MENFRKVKKLDSGVVGVKFLSLISVSLNPRSDMESLLSVMNALVSKLEPLWGSGCERERKLKDGGITCSPLVLSVDTGRMNLVDKDRLVTFR